MKASYEQVKIQLAIKKEDSARLETYIKLYNKFLENKITQILLGFFILTLEPGFPNMVGIRDLILLEIGKIRPPLMAATSISYSAGFKV